MVRMTLTSDLCALRENSARDTQNIVKHYEGDTPITWDLVTGMHLHTRKIKGFCDCLLDEFIKPSPISLRWELYVELRVRCRSFNLSCVPHRACTKRYDNYIILQSNTKRHFENCPKSLLPKIFTDCLIFMLQIQTIPHVQRQLWKYGFFNKMCYEMLLMYFTRFLDWRLIHCCKLAKVNKWFPLLLPIVRDHVLSFLE